MENLTPRSLMAKSQSFCPATMSGAAGSGEVYLDGGGNSSAFGGETKMFARANSEIVMGSRGSVQPQQLSKLHKQVCIATSTMCAHLFILIFSLLENALGRHNGIATKGHFVQARELLEICSGLVQGGAPILHGIAATAYDRNQRNHAKVSVFFFLVSTNIYFENSFLHTQFGRQTYFLGAAGTQRRRNLFE